MSGLSISTAHVPPPCNASSPPRDLRGAAQGFESIMLRQLLDAAEAVDFGGEDGVFGGQAERTFTEMRNAEFARLAAASGALGIAEAIERQFDGNAEQAQGR